MYVKGLLRFLVGMFLGLILGALLGGLIGTIVEQVTAKMSGTMIFGAMIGLWTGLVAGASTGILGKQTRFGLEWLLIFTVGILVGFWIDHHPWVQRGINALTGIGAFSGWLTLFPLRWILKKWIPDKSINWWWVLLVYLAAFGLTVYFAPELIMGVRVAIG